MTSETEAEFLDHRLEQIRTGAAEAIRREVAELRRLGLPVWVSENGHVVDASKNGSSTQPDKTP